MNRSDRDNERHSGVRRTVLVVCAVLLALAVLSFVLVYVGSGSNGIKPLH